MESIVQITMNGERHELPGPLSVAELLRHLGLKPEHVAVEVNRGLVTRSPPGRDRDRDGRRPGGRHPGRRRERLATVSPIEPLEDRHASRCRAGCSSGRASTRRSS